MKKIRLGQERTGNPLLAKYNSEDILRGGML